LAGIENPAFATLIQILLYKANNFYSLAVEITLPLSTESEKFSLQVLFSIQRSKYLS